MSGPETHPDERTLIAAAQQDPSRFAELYELHFERVYAYVARRIGERSASEELTAHVFQQALANLGKFKWRGAPFITWLYRIASNALSDQRKRRSREVSSDDLPNGESVSEVDLEEIEQRALLFKAVDSLPEDQRRVIIMRFAEEKSIRDIASELERTEGAIKQLQFRGLENLRNRLGHKQAN